MVNSTLIKDSLPQHNHNSMPTSKALRFVIFLTLVLDMIGVGITIPILTPLVTAPTTIVPIDILNNNRGFLLGAIILTFSMATFFISPVMGSFADKYSHKRVILFSLCIGFFAYLLFGWAIYNNDIVFLWISRFLAGISASNMSVLYASMAIISNDRNKTANFGLLGMGFAIGFVLGPSIGGILSNSSIINWFSPSLPMLFAAFLVTVNLLIVIIYFPSRLTVPNSEVRVDIKGIFTGLKRAIMDSQLRPILIVAFCYFSGFVFYSQFLPVYLIFKFNLDSVHIGYLFAYIGLWIAFGQGFLVRIIGKKFNSWQVLNISLLVSAFGIFINIFPPELWILYLIIPISNLGNSATFPNLGSMVSSSAPKNLQGQVMGIYLSVQSLANIIIPAIAGILVDISPLAPMIGGSALIMVAWVLFISICPKPVFNESKTE